MERPFDRHSWRKGIGKTTLLLQRIKEFLGNSSESLYVSLDNLWLAKHSLLTLVDYFVKHGGKYLFLDEVHKYPDWSQIIKNIYDDFTALKLVFTEHSTHNRRIGNITGRVLDKFIYRQYDTIVSITKEVDTVIKLHLSFKKDKFKIIHNGINLSQFVRDFSKDENTVRSKIILIQVSAFREQKDQVTLIRAMHYLPQNVNLLLVGDGDKRTKCEDLVKELNLSGRVSFLGVRMDVPQLLKSADIAVLSSHWEGFGLVAVEGMASGRPFIASDVPGLRDVVKGAGLLFPPGNEKKLAEQINSLLSDRELYKKVAKDCLNRAKEYDINNMVDQYIELYKSWIN